MLCQFGKYRSQAGRDKRGQLLGKTPDGPLCCALSNQSCSRMKQHSSEAQKHAKTAVCVGFTQDVSPVWL
eukprot:3483740-Rhodomonas_salina.3